MCKGSKRRKESKHARTSHSIAGSRSYETRSCVSPPTSWLPISAIDEYLHVLSRFRLRERRVLADMLGLFFGFLRPLARSVAITHRSVKMLSANRSLDGGTHYLSELTIDLFDLTSEGT